MCFGCRVHDVHERRYTFEPVHYVTLETVYHGVQAVQVEHHRIRGVIHLDCGQMNVIGIYIEAAQHRLDRLYLFCDKLRSRSVIAYQVGMGAYQFKYLLRFQ